MSVEDHVEVLLSLVHLFVIANAPHKALHNAIYTSEIIATYGDYCFFDQRRRTLLTLLSGGTLRSTSGDFATDPLPLFWQADLVIPLHNVANELSASREKQPNIYQCFRTGCSKDLGSDQ